MINGFGILRIAACLVVAWGAPSIAAAAVEAPVAVISDDRGGGVAERMREVRSLRQEGAEVRITGDVCLSSCTMLLGLPGTCVSPQTIFGFHGPSRRGRPLDEVTFEKVSRLVAAHYPQPVRAWYLNVARYRINGLYKQRGAELIAAGIRAC